jgi:hypothetical protein
VVSCTKARALWKEMRQRWLLPDDKQLSLTGPDWLLILLPSFNRQQKAKVLLLMWRAWFLRSNIIFLSGLETVTGSARFLLSYSETLIGLRKGSNNRGNNKGKNLIDEYDRRETAAKGGHEKVRWEGPQRAWVKLNTDASFCMSQATTSIGAVIRDHEGLVLLTAWNTLRLCASPEEAEAIACLDGLRLATEWIRQPTVVESDCQTLIMAIKDRGSSRGQWAGIIQEIKALSNLLPDCNF